MQHRDDVSSCALIGHRQEDGDYRESWQPQTMSSQALERCKAIAASIRLALGGWGLVGVEFFIKGDDVFFSEVSPQPHDTGMVALCSQDLSEVALHARAPLGLPIPQIIQHGPAASAVILPEGESQDICYGNLVEALRPAHSGLRLFGKPAINGRRPMGVALARADSIDAARELAAGVAAAVTNDALAAPE